MPVCVRVVVCVCVRVCVCVCVRVCVCVCIGQGMQSGVRVRPVKGTAAAPGILSSKTTHCCNERHL